MISTTSICTIGPDINQKEFQIIKKNIEYFYPEITGLGFYGIMFT